MHQHLRLRQRGVDQVPIHQFQPFQIVAVERRAEMTTQEPFVEQPQFARQQRLVVGREAFRRRHLLQFQQLTDRIVEQRVGIVGIDHMQVGLVAEVFQQQEAVFDILCQHARYAHVAGLQQGADLQPG